MKKNLLTLAAVLCITTTAMAQTNPAVSGKDSMDSISLDSIQHEDTDSCQSIMLRHREKNAPTQYQFKRAKYMTTGNEDGLKGFRDYIVRKRRIDEGRPLQPLPLDYFRRW